jgi:hypothetical protein
VQHLPADAPAPVAPVAGGAVAGPADDAAELLGVQVEQAARLSVFIADGRRGLFLVAHQPWISPSAIEIRSASDRYRADTGCGGPVIAGYVRTSPVRVVTERPYRHR